MKVIAPLFSLILATAFGVSCRKKAEKSNPENLDSIPKVTLTLDQLTAKIESDPKNALYYYQRGILHYENGDQTSAIRDLTQAINLKSDYAEAYHDRGLCHFELDRPDSALADFNQAITLNEKFVEAYYNRAILYESLNLIEKALSDYNRCIQIDPTFGPAYYNRGVHLFKKDRKKACDDFKKAAKLGDKDAENAYLEHCN
ncbi:MAG: tetratricopeptide repeat protein [Flavobacteriales bacterium]|nr:tetratricopeptide repeat protein [Flavobacteriales bacterium]